MLYQLAQGYQTRQAPRGGLDPQTGFPCWIQHMRLVRHGPHMQHTLLGLAHAACSWQDCQTQERKRKETSTQARGQLLAPSSLEINTENRKIHQNKSRDSDPRHVSLRARGTPPASCTGSRAVAEREEGAGPGGYQ
ncbi:hypothetical protein Y1Q_0005787 [Alligator mississippiensis]|uniref:Uncharacterized protein n=1 Tax=Alligator mississippiensis TaxID=8496 RepID=A0A151MFX1_ALLMI|nr:hypothetical protein Y1Q_0005787 [Alligator mississippiensis]